MRYKFIDCAKGIGIIFVVLSHCNIATTIINSFIMPLFFFCSGLTFNNSTDLKNFIIKKIKKLYLPYILFNTILLTFHNIFVELQMIEGRMYHLKDILNKILRILLFDNPEELFSQSWFLLVLFISNILFFFISKYSKSKRLLLYVACWFVGLAISYKTTNLYCNCKMISCCLQALLYIGLGYESKKMQYNNIYIVIGGLLLLLVLSYIQINNGLVIDVRTCSYSNIPMFLLTSIFCIYSIFYISKLICKKNSIFLKILSYIGKNNFYVYMYHILIFCIMSKVLAIFIHNDVQQIRKFPYVLDKKLILQLVYFVCGIGIPLIVTKISNLIKKLIIK